MQWISVKDMLPEVGQYILICNSNAVEDNIVCEAVYLDNFFYISQINERAELVTHWMKLPEPPKD